MIFDFLYYCCYSALLKGKKNGTGEERASFMLSSILSIYAITFYFLLSVRLNLKQSHPLFIAGASFTVIIATFWCTSYFFVKTGRYILLLEKYKRPKYNKTLLALIAWILFLSAFILFGYAGVNFDKHYH